MSVLPVRRHVHAVPLEVRKGWQILKMELDIVASCHVGAASSLSSTEPAVLVQQSHLSSPSTAFKASVCAVIKYKSIWNAHTLSFSFHNACVPPLDRVAVHPRLVLNLSSFAS